MNITEKEFTYLASQIVCYDPTNYEHLTSDYKHDGTSFSLVKPFLIYGLELLSL